MSEEEKEETTEEQTDAEQTPAEDAAAEQESSGETAPDEAPEAESAAPEESGSDPLADLHWKERRRLLRSRESGAPGPEKSPEQRDEGRRKARAAKAGARRRRRAGDGSKAETGSGEGTPRAERTRTGKPKERQGLVTSDKSDKTITVQIDSARRHPVYEKIVRQRHKIHVHDERNEAGEGDVVRVIETRKLSRTKHWRLVEIVEKAR
jgi:small subunit ribosomal protein S17